MYKQCINEIIASQSSASGYSFHDKNTKTSMGSTTSGSDLLCIKEVPETSLGSVFMIIFTIWNKHLNYVVVDDMIVSQQANEVKYIEYMEKVTSCIYYGKTLFTKYSTKWKGNQCSLVVKRNQYLLMITNGVELQARALYRFLFISIILYMKIIAPWLDYSSSLVIKFCCSCDFTV